MMPLFVPSPRTDQTYQEATLWSNLHNTKLNKVRRLLGHH